MGLSQQHVGWFLAFSILLLCVALSGCDGGEQIELAKQSALDKFEAKQQVQVKAEQPADKPSDGKPIDDKPKIPAKHQHFNMPEAVKPAELRFQDPAVGETLVRFDAAARKLADDTWTEHADAEYPYLNWNSGSGGYRQKYQAVWRSTSQSVAISTELNNKPRVAYGFELSAIANQPSRWRASLGYGLSNPINRSWQSFSLAFFHPQHWPAVSEEPTPGLVLGPFGPSFSARRKDDQFDYRFLVHSRGQIASLKNEDIARYLKSADSFRDAALDELNLLEEQVRVRIESGSGCEIWTHGKSSAEPPQLVGPLTRSDEVPETIKKSVLEQALEDIGRRKKLVEENHVELHKAAVAAFPPLLELLTSP